MEKRYRGRGCEVHVFSYERDCLPSTERSIAKNTQTDYDMMCCQHQRQISDSYANHAMQKFNYGVERHMVFGPQDIKTEIIYQLYKRPARSLPESPPIRFWNRV